MNPFAQGPPLGSTDSVPAWLTPGEAVIPEPAAQNPKNKPIIRKLVNEGRRKNAQEGQADDVWSNLQSMAAGYSDGSTGLPAEIWSKPWNELTPQQKEAFAIDVFEKRSTEAPSHFEKDGVTPLRNQPKKGQEPTTAAGKYQLTDGWVKDYQRITGSKEDPRRTMEDSRKAFLALSDHYATNFASDSYKPTPEDILGSHHEGAGTWKKFKETGDTKVLSPAFQGEDKKKYFTRAGLLSDLPSAVNTSSGIPPAETLELDENGFARVIPGRRPLQKAPPEMRFPPSAPPAMAASKGAQPGQEMRYPPAPPALPPEPGVPGVDNAGAGIRIADVPVVVDPKYAGLDAKTTKIMSSLEHPVIKAQMEALQSEAKALSAAEQKPISKGWLADRLANIWGETGLFREQDLARFALVAAGGLLFGGSVNGSLLYAARDTMKEADQRKDQETNQKESIRREKKQEISRIENTMRSMEQQSALADVAAQNAAGVRDAAETQSLRGDLRERTQQWEANVTKDLGAILDDDVRLKVNQLMDQGRKLGNQPALQEAHYSAAARLVGEYASNSAKRAAARAQALEGKSGPVKEFGRYMLPGENRLITVFHDPSNPGVQVITRGDGWLRLPKNWENGAVDEKRYDLSMKEIRDLTTSGIAVALKGNPTIASQRQKFPEADIKDLSENLAGKLQMTLGTYGRTGLQNPKEYSQLINNAMRGIIEYRGPDVRLMDVDTIAKIVDTSVLASQHQPQSVTMMSDKKGEAKKQIGPDAYLVLNQAIQNRMESSSKGGRPIKPQEALDMLNREWESYLAKSPSQREFANNLEMSSNFQKDGMSAFTWWLKNGRELKPPKQQ